MASPAIGTGTGNIQTATSAGSVTSLSISAPTNAVTGDLLILAFVTNASKTLTATGWTSIGSIVQNGTVSQPDIEVWWRTHDGSSSYSVSWSGGTTAVGGIMLVTGADASPIDVSATYRSSYDSPATAQTAPSVTTTVADTLLLNFYANTNGADYTPASSQTELFDLSNTCVLEGTKLNVASAGATGTKTSTASFSAGWVAISVAIKPTPAKPRSSVPMVIG